MNNMARLLGSFRSKKVAVLGDILLDLYVLGDVERISPEAPVPVVLERSRRAILGGAGNVAANIASLHGKTTLIGVLGRDEEGRIIRSLCRTLHIKPSCVLDKDRPTTLKMRPMVRRHQLLRIDRETTKPITGKVEDQLIDTVRRLPHQHIFIISDYAKGCVTKRVIQAVKGRFGADRIIAGIKPRNAALYEGVACITLNLKECYDLLGVRAETPGTAVQAVKKLSERFKSSIVLTRGEFGMTVYDREEKKTFHIPSRTIQVFDVTGAGDTVLAILGLGFASGGRLNESAELANRAAGIVVGREGTATVKAEEFGKYLRDA